MSKSLQYVKIFNTLKDANGPVTVSAIKSIDGIVPARLSTYLWEIKKNTGFAVKANRDGRTVVSYELVGARPGPVVATVAKTSVAKTVKSKVFKVNAKAKTESTVSVVDEFAPTKAGPVDVLDEMDTDITDFEDREYAQGVVSGKF